uniref:RAS p21 protein activator 4 n=1 Tax=Paramormyrops kingsleyae TaxID=1676925 RepID=A0A3B3R060_9TELE
MAKRSTLFIRIVEGKNLPVKDISGSSDPYCIVRIDSEAIIRTATIWKTLSPFWGEEYNVHLPPSFHTVSFHVLDEDSLRWHCCLLGYGNAYVSVGVDGWVNLTEIDPDEEVQGEIHLQISVLGKGDARILRCHVLEARDLARKDRNGASDPFVRVRCNGKTHETAVVKKSCYPRWNESFEFEIDEAAGEMPLSVEVWDWDLVSKNDFLGRVLFSINKLQFAIQQEDAWFRLGPDKPKHSQPQPERAVFMSMSETQSPCILYPLQKVKFIAVTSFLCLRFISPAIMSPKLFHLREKHADARTSRTLLLLAKAIQTIGNLDTLACCSKEPWMVPLQPTIQQGIDHLKDFITQLVSFEDREDPGRQAQVGLQCGSMEKEGFLLLHRTKDKCMLMASPFRKYYVTLGKDTLSYAKTQHSKKSSFIALPKIKAVEKVEEKSFGSANVMQIISSEENGQMETLYLDCKSVNELNQWLSALRKACIHNTDTMSSYHPGIYKGDKWSCCHQKDKADAGCDKTRHGVTLQEWYDPLDPDLESQLIFRHLIGVKQVMRSQLGSSLPGPAKPDEIGRFFSVLQELQETHASVDEVERSREKSLLLELQT